MDSLIAASARALAAGDALGALKRVACATTRRRWPARHRDGAAGRASAGARAAAARGPRLRRARGAGARALRVAEAEVALAMRDLGGSPRALAARRRRWRSTATAPMRCTRA
jgi:hypothetical protein